MPDSVSPTGDRTVVVHRFGALTYISLAFNALILLLILIGIVAHHHRPEGRMGDEGPMGGDRHMGHHEWAEGGEGFHHDGFRRHEGWGRHEGFGGGPGGEEGRCGMGGGPGMGDPRCMGDGDRPGFGGPPMGGFNGGDHFGPKTPPSAEEMTDRFMLMLTQKLTLTDQESAQIRPIVQGGIAQFQKDMEAQKQAHQKMIEDAKAKVRAVLTPDQQKQFDDMTAKMGPPPAPATK